LLSLLQITKLNIVKTRITTAVAIIIFSVAQFSCATSQAPTDLTRESIIPRPVLVQATAESFTMTDKTDIYVQGESADAELIGNYLAGKLNPSTGLVFEVKNTAEVPKKGNIYLVINKDIQGLGEEGYELTISTKMVQISAPKAAGLFYGVQTLLQILPAKVELTNQIGPWTLATGTIKDYPEYSYRGAMLDVARHFFKPEDVKRLIDQMARYKLNQLHLHLADDQGWRIEIKSWPNLTTIGGSTQVGGGAGGFYTQEEYTDIVKYAQSRYITIIPEIDMPGHTNAALASYAELNCNGKATKLYTGTNVGFSTLCTSKEITYQFVSDVFREIAAITPGPYIHIGGDESHVTKKEDYIPFISRVQEIVTSTGKIPMGWDDIALSTLKPGTVCQHWATVKNAVSAAGQGAKLVLSPASKAYLDMKYDSTTTLGLNWAGYVEVDKGYSWDPANYVPGVNRSSILGIEAALWSETVTNKDEVDYMVFPRLPGYAEIGWTPAALRSWDEYKIRLGKQGQRFTAMGIKFYKSPLVQW
jgi:hexosaminidase